MSQKSDQKGPQEHNLKLCDGFGCYKQHTWKNEGWFNWPCSPLLIDYVDMLEGHITFKSYDSVFIDITQRKCSNDLDYIYNA